MGIKKRSTWFFVGVFCLILSLAAGPEIALAQSKDQQRYDKLMRIVEKQQKQIESQAAAIAELKEMVSDLSKQARQPAAPAAAKKTPAPTPADVQLYGQVNRGVLWTNDGNQDKFYHVDNDHSSTRVGIKVKKELIQDFNAGAKFEVQFESNSTVAVDQNNDRGIGVDNFTQRHLDFFLQSKRLGKLSLGQGDTASNGASEVDLSGTAVIGNSDPELTAGGTLFYNPAAGALSTTTVRAVFNNMDGLSRDDRLRYDSPSIFGLKLAASTIAGGANDVALSFKGESKWIKAAAAVAYANPAGNSALVENQLNGSASILFANGLNFTLAGGYQTTQNANRNEPFFYYGKIGYRRKFFAIGETAFAVDYSRHENVAQNNDAATAYGGMLVQSISRWNTEIYVGYLRYELDRTGVSFDAVNAVLGGARIKF